MTLMVRDGVRAMILALALVGCDDKSKPDFEAEAERLKAYIVDAAPQDATKLDADFDGKVRLVGYELSPAKPVKPGQRVTLTLYWQATKPVEPGFRLFTHVLDGSGDRIETLDDEGPLREPRDGRPALPPDAWKAGKVYVDELRFKVPKSVKTDKIDVVAGVFRKEERMQVVAGEKDGAGAAKVVTIAIASKDAGEKEGRSNAVEAPKLGPKQKIAIDGKLDEEPWSRAVQFELGDPHAAKNVKVATIGVKVRLLWSDSGFYTGIEVKDANVTREAGDEKKEVRLDFGDAIEFLIDPEKADNEDYYLIQFGPSNRVFDTRFDAFKDPAPENGPWGHEGWSSHAKSAVTVKGTLGKSDDKGEDKDEGYVVEAFVPWKSFSATENREPPKPGDVWRINVLGLENDAVVTWSPVNGRGFHRVERFGKVTWVDAAPPTTDKPAEGAGGAGAKPAAEPAKPGASKAAPAKLEAPKPAAPPPAAPAASK
jgi:hypothetical protein